MNIKTKMLKCDVSGQKSGVRILLTPILCILSWFNVLTLFSHPSSLIPHTLSTVPPERLEARQAFSELKFGIFIHWGIYSMFGAGEWHQNLTGKGEGLRAAEYDVAANAFYPHDFDAREWVKAFKAAGAKYVVFTSRHHDGFSMWDTKASDYNIVKATPFKRDVVKELAEACREEGIKLGLYYSLMDWHREDYPTGRTLAARAFVDKSHEDYASYLAFMKAQLTELLTNYGDILCIWLDGEWDHEKTGLDWHFDEIYSLIHSLQPKCLVLNNHHHAMRDGEDIQGFERDAPGENKAGYSEGQKVEREFPLETCDTMVKGAWGWQADARDWKSAKDVRGQLERVNGMGANLLLNIGPQPDGRLPAEAMKTLRNLAQSCEDVNSLACAPAGDVVAPYGKFVDGMLSRIRPSGWLAAACHKQAEGLTGHPEALSYPYDTCLWAGSISRMGEHGAGWWRYEQTAYYTDGLLRLGYALGDAGLVGKGVAGVDYTLDHASPEGYLGNECTWDGKKHKLENGYKMWPMAVFFRAMKAKYDATGDNRIPAALSKYYLLHEADTVAETRNTISAEGILWTYGLTGDKRLLDLAETAWARKKAKKDDWSGDLTPQNCADDKPIYMHGVSYAEELKIPILLYAYTGKREYLDQAVNAERKLVRDHMLPDGCPSSTEQTRGNTVHWGHETCVVSDYTWSLGYFLEETGEASYADKIERCVLNAGFGAVDGDFKSLQYFSNLNQFIATSKSNHNLLAYGSTWMQYRPTHETECCAGNVHRFLPNYVSRMWLKDAEGAPVAALYGPSAVDFGWAKITEETRYPADGKIVFRFSVKQPKENAFTYRVPGWCVKGASLKINGELAQAGEPGTFATVRRTFRDGDTIELDFPMETVFEVLPRRRYVIKDAVTKWVGEIEGRSVSQGTVVRRGPLVFAYPIPETRTEDVAEHPNMHGKKSANPDFKCWDIRPAGPFNFALAAHTAEVEENEFGVSVKVPVRRIEWNLEDGRFTPDVPESPKTISDKVETIRLVPYGLTTLRLAVFPDLR